VVQLIGAGQLIWAESEVTYLFRAIEKGHQVVGNSLSKKELEDLSRKGFEPAPTIKDLISKLKAPRIVFLYIPHGDPMYTILKIVSLK
jgi:6-phosphogluconate dehydrogenase (decarboxylating)